MLHELSTGGAVALPADLCHTLRRGPPNSVVLHIRMLDSTAQAQQEALGVLGVNFVHGVLTNGRDFGAIIDGLMDELSRGRIEVCLHHRGSKVGNVGHKVHVLQGSDSGAIIGLHKNCSRMEALPLVSCYF